MNGLSDHLHRFWIEWNHAAMPDSRVGARLGCGVTALDLEDAKTLIAAVALDGEPLPPIARVIENVDVRTLDRGHVLPNMGDPSVRGLWFPLY